ncbi:MAG: hypothetical protein ACPGO5_03170 [Patescibacteria group bacterium]
MLIIEIIGRTLDVIGKLLVAFTAIMVHHRFLQEHKVDNAVFSVMKREQRMGIWGIVLMVIGFILELVGRVW